MTDTRISAADLLRLAAIASVSPEGTADEVVAILQRTGPTEEIEARQQGRLVSMSQEDKRALDEISAREAGRIALLDDADSDKLAKPE